MNIINKYYRISFFKHAVVSFELLQIPKFNALLHLYINNDLYRGYHPFKG